MTHESMQRRIRGANTARYADGSEVEEYRKKPHHDIRIRLAVDLVAKGLNSFMADRRRVVRVVELAGASGYAAELLRRSSDLWVCATDISLEAVAEDRSGAHVVVDASVQLPLKDCALHGLLAGDIIEHIFDTHLFLRECYRVLTPGGIVVLSTPNLATLQDRWRFLRGASPRHVSPMHPYLWLHIRQFTLSSLAQALRQSGFQIECIRSNEVQWDFASGRRWSSAVLARIFPSLGKSLVALARRPR
jgi:SAM-dependent methyltransferase